MSISITDRVSSLPPERLAQVLATLNEASSALRGEPIAVVGMGCRLPNGIRGPREFQALLGEGRVVIGPVDPQRWLGDPTGVQGGFLAHVFDFDATYFGISPREAEGMDPQHRVLLEVTVEALEDAGFEPEPLRRSHTGVFVGCYHDDFREVDNDEPSAYSATGNAGSMASGRIAYALDLRGPAITFDTACSSSLIAIHEACRSLSLRECEVAIAAGVNIMLSRATHDSLASWRMLSPRFRCSAFDAAADGFVRGEGAGAVVLKRLADAIAQGDTVLAVVRGSAVNSDGRSQGITAPNGRSQVEVMSAALDSADVEPGSVGFVETHGTGTALGDPIEFEALDAVYGRSEGTSCVLGAVKSNLGHLEAAAGVIAFIKTVLVLNDDFIPANPGFTRLNDKIDASGSRLQIADARMPWPTTEGPRRAAVSSFGFSGTNVHLILERGSRPAEEWREVRTWHHTTFAPPALARATPQALDWCLVPGYTEVDAAGADSSQRTVLVVSPLGERAARLAAELADLGCRVTGGGRRGRRL